MNLRSFFVCLFALCYGSSTRADEASTVEIDRTPATVAPESQGARLTLSLDDAPLLQILHLLGATGPAKFRLGVLPDSVVSVNWRDENPFASLDELVSRAGWRLQREGGNYFLLPRTADANGIAPAGAWAQWTKATPPPREALSGPDEAMKIRLSGKLAAPSATDKVPPTLAARDAALWKVLLPTTQTTGAPGIRLQADWPWPTSEGAEYIWLRCKFPLATMPHGARLLLYSGNQADIFVNGAPLARNWTGLRAFDTEPLLKRGANVIVVRWNRAQLARRASPDPPTLFYEWVFDKTQGAGLPGEIVRDRGEFR